MKVNSISYPTTSQNFYAVTPKDNGKRSLRKQQPSHTILHDSLVTAGSWFGFGVVLDIIARRFVFFKSPTKNSIAVNGIIGVGAGVLTCCSRLIHRNHNG